MDVTSGEATAAGRARWFELRRPIARVRNVDVLVYTGTFVWGAVCAAAAMLEQHFFVLRRYDLGNFTQAIWSTAHGHFLQVTEVGGANVSRLGIHVDPIIVGLAPAVVDLVEPESPARRSRDRSRPRRLPPLLARAQAPAQRNATRAS